MHIFVLLAILPVVFAAPLIKVKRDDIIAGKYIIKLKGDINTSSEAEIKASISATPDFEYSLPSFRGFAGTLSDEELARLQASNSIEYIQQDARVYASALVEQENATWGLARISHREPGSTTYLFDDTAGEGTCSYIIDTGIFVDHPEFQGRAKFLTDTSGEGLLEDGFGHGTHVAGTVGSATYGVAKKTKLFAVKVLDSDGLGTNSGVIAGIQFVIDDAKTRSTECPKGIVSNMSLGGTTKVAVNEAAAALVASGVFLAAAAGNERADAENSSPGSEPTVCTVGATTFNDTFAEFSNFGSTVDILAPGVNVLSTWNDGGIRSISGTSMAAPHIAGLGAYLLGLGDADVESLCETIVGLATAGAIDASTLKAGTPNFLAYNGVDEGY